MSANGVTLYGRTQWAVMPTGDNRSAHLNRATITFEFHAQKSDAKTDSEP
jgi:hypothetical protein